MTLVYERCKNRFRFFSSFHLIGHGIELTKCLFWAFLSEGFLYFKTFYCVCQRCHSFWSCMFWKCYHLLVLPCILGLRVTLIKIQSKMFKKENANLGFGPHFYDNFKEFVRICELFTTYFLRNIYFGLQNSITYIPIWLQKVNKWYFRRNNFKNHSIVEIVAIP